MKICLIGSFAQSLINFRGPLLEEIGELGHAAIACAPDASARTRQQLAALGVRYCEVPMSRTGLNPAGDFRALLFLIRMLRRERPDLLITYTMKPVIYGSLAGRLAGVPRVFSMITGLGYMLSNHGPRQRILSPLVKGALRVSLKRNEKIFFQNPDNLECFQDLGLITNPGQAVLINGSGVDIDRFSPAPCPARTSFLLIARLLLDKGIREYVEAARQIRASRPDVSFKLAGFLDANPLSISQSELQSWVDEGVIEYLGRLDDVRPAIAESTVYVLPSYAEGTPRTVLEAISMGRAIITSDAPGCRETVIDGLNGFLVPIKDSAALARKMKLFLDDPSLVRRMGQHSKRIAVEKYDVKKVNRVILSHLGLIDDPPD